MKLMRSTPYTVVVCATLAFLGGRVEAAADDGASADQPVLGYVLDTKASGLRAVLGIAESPRFGNLLKLPDGVAILAVAPGHDWALATRNADGVTETGAFAITAGTFARLTEGSAEQYVFSPSGRDLLIARDNGAVAFSGLPDSPKESLRLDAAAAVPVALNDGARFAVVRSEGRVEVWSASGRAFLGESTQVAAAAFVAGSDALLIYAKEPGALSLLEDPLASGSTREIAAGLEGIDRIAAGRGEITLAKSSGGVIVLNSSGERLRDFDTPPVKSLDSMRLPAFRLISSEAGEPAWLLGPNGVSGVPAVREVVE